MKSSERLLKWDGGCVDLDAIVAVLLFDHEVVGGPHSWWLNFYYGDSGKFVSSERFQTREAAIELLERVYTFLDSST